MAQQNKGDRNLVQVPLPPEVYTALETEAPDYLGPFVAAVMATFFGQTHVHIDVKTIAALPVRREAYDAITQRANKQGVSLAQYVTTTVTDALGAPDLAAEFEFDGEAESDGLFPVGVEKNSQALDDKKPPLPVRVARDAYLLLKEEAPLHGTSMGKFIADILATFFAMPAHVHAVETIAALPVQRAAYDAVAALADRKGFTLVDYVTAMVAQALSMPELAATTGGGTQQMLEVAAHRGDAAA